MLILILDTYVVGELKHKRILSIEVNYEGEKDYEEFSVNSMGVIGVILRELLTSSLQLSRDAMAFELTSGETILTEEKITCMVSLYGVTTEFTEDKVDVLGSNVVVPRLLSTSIDRDTDAILIEFEDRIVTIYYCYIITS